MQEDIMTFKEAIAYLKLSRSTILRLMVKEKIIGHKIGRQWRFYKSELRACVCADHAKVEQGANHDHQ